MKPFWELFYTWPKNSVVTEEAQAVLVFRERHSGNLLRSRRKLFIEKIILEFITVLW